MALLIIALCWADKECSEEVGPFSVFGGEAAMKARRVCRLVFPGVHTALSFWNGIVCIASPKPLGRTLLGG